MAGYKARRARNQSYRALRRSWNAGHRPIIGHENVSSAGLYRSMESLSMSVGGTISIIGINEKGERVQESWDMKNIFAATFDEWLICRFMKKPRVMYFKHFSRIATGPIIQLGPKPEEEPQHERLESPNGDFYCTPWCAACELNGRPEGDRLIIELGKHEDWENNDG